MFVQILYLDGFLGRLIYVLVFLDFWPWLNLLWLWNLFVCPSVSYWSPFSSSLSWLQCYHGFRRKTPLIPKQAAAAKSLQSFPTLHDPIDGSPLGSAVPGILQARTLEWAAISFPNAWKWKVKVKSLSRVRLLATPWTAAHQASSYMGFSRQEYWSGVPLPSPQNKLEELFPGFH